MASYTVNHGERAAHAKTLAANTVDTVTFVDDCQSIEVLNVDGAAAIYFRTDGTPAVAGAFAYIIPAIAGASLNVEEPSDVSVIKLISSGTPTYSVTRIR